MKTILKTSLIVVIFSLAVVACQPILSPIVTQPIEKTATALPVEQPTDQIKPSETALPTASVEPTVEPTEVPVVEKSITEVDTVECDPGLYLSFDPDVWQTIEGKPGQCLELKGEETCIIHSNWGHGYDAEYIGVSSSDQKIGNTTFTISRYFYRPNSKNIIYSYTWNGGYISAENPQGLDLSDNCLDQLDEVMRLSEVKGFKQ